MSEIVDYITQIQIIVIKFTDFIANKKKWCKLIVKLGQRAECRTINKYKWKNVVRNKKQWVVNFFSWITKR